MLSLFKREAVPFDTITLTHVHWVLVLLKFLICDSIVSNLYFIICNINTLFCSTMGYLLTITKKTGHEAWLRIGLFVITSFVYLLFVSVATSPLYDSDGIDSLAFRIIAYKWMNGFLPYVDIFDHKGPYIYLINIIGLLINKNYGILILQTINLSAILELSYRIGALYSLSKVRICLAIGLMLLVGVGFFQEGDLTEEWSLCFVTYPLYLFLRFLGSPNAKTPTMNNHKPIWAFIYGACFGIVAFIRINNASIICAVVLVAAFMCIKQREWSALGVNALAALGGLLLTTAPICAYFAFHHAFSDLIFGTFGLNLIYTKVWPEINGLNQNALIYANFFKMLWLVYLGVLVVAISLQNRRFTTWGAVLIMSSIITFLTLLSGMGYLHYFMMTLPLCFIFFCIVLSLKWDLCLALVALMLVPGSDLFKCTCEGIREKIYLWSHSEYEAYFKGTDVLLDTYVPAEELDDVYIYNRMGNLAPMWRRGVILKQRFIFLQEKFPKVNEKMRDYLIKDLIERSPKWIITHEGQAKPENPLFLNKIKTEYVLVDSVDVIKLYKLK